jgi:hypothetical protein
MLRRFLDKEVGKLNWQIKSGKAVITIFIYRIVPTCGIIREEEIKAKKGKEEKYSRIGQGWEGRSGETVK